MIAADGRIANGMAATIAVALDTAGSVSMLGDKRGATVRKLRCELVLHRRVRNSQRRGGRALRSFRTGITAFSARPRHCRASVMRLPPCCEDNWRFRRTAWDGSPR